MKYYSEVLRKTFDTEKDCVQAEKEYTDKVNAEQAKQKALTDARKGRAKEVENAYKAVLEAQKHYNELRNKFIEDYGSWHMTISSKGSIEDILNTLFECL